MGRPTSTSDPLDALIPAPWSPRRRALGAVAMVAILAVAIALVTAGVLGPQLRHGHTWGSGTQDLGAAIEADRIVPIRNTGRLPVEVIRFAPPALDDVTWTSVEGLPATLQPGETIEVRVRFRTEGCAIDARGFDAFPFEARGGVAPARQIEIRGMSPSAPPATFDGIDSAAGLDRTQAGSWLVEVIDVVCLERAGLLDG
ncbi:MAG: hypothetical protein JJT89_17280 [Nitriliruptoraceae bacterium]|nr:hypothetical protein [Nitriliruptoraceae bacterium]